MSILRSIDLTNIESMTSNQVVGLTNNILTEMENINGAEDSNGFKYIAFKSINTINIFKIYQSKDGGSTWNDLNLPTPIGAYGTGSTSYKTPSIYYYNNKLYVTFLERTSSDIANDTHVFYNVYDITNEVWLYSTNSLIIPDSFQYFELTSFIGANISIVDADGKWFAITRANTAASSTGCRFYYNISIDNGENWSGRTGIGTRNYNWSICLDVYGYINVVYQEYHYTTGSIYHLVWNGSSFNSPVEIDSGFYYTSDICYLCINQNSGKLWLLKESSSKYKIYYKTSSGDWTELGNSLNSGGVILSDDNDILHCFYLSGNTLKYKYYDSGWSSEYTVPISNISYSYSNSPVILFSSTSFNLWFLSGTNTSTSMGVDYLILDVPMIYNSALIIDGIEVEFHIKELYDNNNAIYKENSINSNPLWYDTPNTTLSYYGNTRRIINIKGFCDYNDRLILKNAMKRYIKVYPTIYPPQSKDNITPDSYYVIKNFTTTYKLNNNTVFFEMDLIFGGAS